MALLSKSPDSEETLRIIHVSDLHIGFIPGGRSYLRLIHSGLNSVLKQPSLSTERIILRSALQTQMATADWLIITGDLSHSGMPGDMKEAANFVREVDGDITPAEMLPQSRVRLLPGNHDRYQEHGPYPGNTRTFEREFSSYWNRGQAVEFATLSNRFQIQAAFVDFSLRETEAGSLRHSLKGVASLDFEEIRQVITMLGQGCAYDDLLDNLVTESARRIKEGWRLIWVLHFAPFPRRLNNTLRNALRLRGEQRLMHHARQLGISHILCGHTHLIDQYISNNVEIFCSGPSLKGRREERAGFFCIDLDASNEKLRTKQWDLFLRSEGDLSYKPAPPYSYL